MWDEGINGELMMLMICSKRQDGACEGHNFPCCGVPHERDNPCDLPCSGGVCVPYKPTDYPTFSAGTMREILSQRERRGTPIEDTYTTREVTIKEFDSYKNRYARGRMLSGWDFNSFIHVNPATVKEE